MRSAAEATVPATAIIAIMAIVTPALLLVDLCPSTRLRIMDDDPLIERLWIEAWLEWWAEE
jgi:hypothetical protein